MNSRLSRPFDLKVSWSHTFREHVTVEPSIGFYQPLQLRELWLAGERAQRIVDGSRGTDWRHQSHGAQCRSCRGRTGSYSLGAPRQIEFGLRVKF